MDVAQALLRLQGVCVLNYIDDWLILAQSKHVAVRHRDVVLVHIKDLGLRLNDKKSVLSQITEDHFSLSGMGFDSDVGTSVCCSYQIYSSSWS